MSWRPLLLLALAACSSTDEEELNQLEDYRQRATRYYSSDDLDRAEQQARRGLELDPENGMLNLILGRTLLRRRNLRSVLDAQDPLLLAHDALDDWRSAFSLGESHVRYAEFLIAEASILESRSADLAEDDTEGMEEMRRRATHARSVASQHLMEAVPLLEASLAENPDYPFTLQLTATAYVHLGRDEEALQLLEDLALLLGDSRRFKNRQLALQELEMWQEDQLRRDLRDDIRFEAESRGLAATILLRQKRYAEAEQELTRILEIDPDRDNEYFNRGLARYRQGQLAAAGGDMEIFLRKTKSPYDSPEVKRALEILEEYRGPGAAAVPATRPR